MWRILVMSIGLLYTTLSFAQQDGIVSGDEPDQEQWVHQHIVREAYKLLKAQIGYDIPVLQNHIGYNETGDMAFIPGNKVVIGAYREDEEDPVYGYYGIGGAYVTNTHFWDPDGGDGSHFCINPTNECFENAYVKASAYFFGGPFIYNYPQSTNNPYWFACGAPGLITGFVFEFDNIFDFYLTGSARVLAVRNVAGYLDYCDYPVEVQWVQSFREKISWEILGRVAHLLADASTPAHAHNDQHWPDADTYEVTMGQNNYYTNWDYMDAVAQNNLFGGAINVLNKPNPLKYLFYTSAQIAGHFPSDDVAGNNNQGLNEPFANYPPLQTIINLLGTPPSSVNVNQIASTSFVYSIRATAALLHWFSNEVGIIPPPPPPIGVTISGPTSAQKFTTSNFTSTVTGAQGDIMYQWEQYVVCCTDGHDCGYYFSRGNSSTLSVYNVGYHYRLRLTVTDGANRSAQDIHYVTVEYCVGTGGGGCPTIAFNVDGEMTDDNPLLITSLSNPGLDVTDHYLIQNPVTPVGNKINLRIHEPQTEHTWLDYVELLEAKVKSDELVAVNDKEEIINYKKLTTPVTVLLNGATDITFLLAEMDTLDIMLSEGDILTIRRNSLSAEGDGELILGGEEPPIAKDRPSVLLRIASDKEKNTESIGDVNGFSPIGELFFRPKESIIAKKLSNLPQGDLEIVINKTLALNYLAIAKNLKTAIVNRLELLSANHSQYGDVKAKVTSINQNYAELIPGEIIDLEFANGTIPAEKRAYILKSVGRYETDTTLVFSKLTNATKEEIIPKENKLFENYPNPFNPTTQIKYSVKENGLVTLKVYDVLGKEVAELVNEEKPAGEYTVTFEAENLSSGIYFYTITAKDFQQTKKMILIK